jgi:hypothetical protein
MTKIEHSLEKKQKLEDWAAWFKKNHRCGSCPFVIDEVGIGIGIQRNCDFVCQMEIDEIVKEMEGCGVDV